MVGMSTRDRLEDLFLSPRGLLGSVDLLVRERHTAALTVIYSAIDVAASLGVDGLRDVGRKDYEAWCNRWMTVVPNVGDPITGFDLYAARCAVLHTYGVESGLTRRGDRRRGSRDEPSRRARRIFPQWLDRGLGIRWNALERDIGDVGVVVVIEHLATALRAGVVRYIDHVTTTPELEAIANMRLGQVMQRTHYNALQRFMPQRF